ncbi:MAG: M4 family metallopeptidase [Parasporobacterium sp.]|nr:M4 family metallopeptidase [Parasporobacterium sp.]
MKRSLKKVTVSVIAILLLLSMVLTACGEQKPASESVGKTLKEIKLDQDAFTGKGSVTKFIGEPFYDGKIQTDEDAYEAVSSVLEEIGGDESTQLQLKSSQPTEDGITYYIFSQVADLIDVYGSAVKLIVNKDQEAIGLVSTIVPNLTVEKDQNWEISAAEAEEIVKKKVESEAGMNVVPGITEEAVVPISPGAKYYGYCWVVYTNNPNPDTHAPYFAHYVAIDGSYLYNVSVSGPGNKEALSGATASFAFDSSEYEPSEWKGTVTKHDGTQEELTVPVLIDKTNGETILGDAKRKVLCADYADFNYNNTLTPRASKDNAFAGNELLIYKAFLDVYDMYDEVGWSGPDGEGTPALLEMDMVDQDGEVIQNAYYSGSAQGFKTFLFNRLDPDGECYDIIAHEFSHCLTETAMTYSLYENEQGAINEGMSDIFGNIIEAYLDKTEDETWLIQENGNKPIRSMSDPNKFQQPAFVWDRFYVPPAATCSGINDNGGVHTDSSLLNIIAYALNEAGMPLEDQLYYWMNVAFSMTPKTDFAQMAELLPWCMNLLGYTDYLDVLNNAINETGITDRHFPEKIPEGTGMIYMEFPDTVDFAKYPCSVLFYNLENNLEYEETWPDANNGIVLSTLNTGNYLIEFLFYDENEDPASSAIATANGWKLLNLDERKAFFENVSSEGAAPEYYATVGEGDIIEVETETLVSHLN